MRNNSSGYLPDSHGHGEFLPRKTYLSVVVDNIQLNNACVAVTVVRPTD